MVWAGAGAAWRNAFVARSSGPSRKIEFLYGSARCGPQHQPFSAPNLDSVVLSLCPCFTFFFFLLFFLHVLLVSPPPIAHGRCVSPAAQAGD